MEVSEKLEESYMYMINMKRAGISEGLAMQQADYKDRHHYGIRGQWRRYKERKAAERKAKEDAKPKYVGQENLTLEVTMKAAENDELDSVEGTESTLTEFPSADDTPEEEYAHLIEEELARRQRLADIEAGLIVVRQPFEFIPRVFCFPAYVCDCCTILSVVVVVRLLWLLQTRRKSRIPSQKMPKEQAPVQAWKKAKPLSRRLTARQWLGIAHVMATVRTGTVLTMA